MPNRAKRRALKFADRLLRAQQVESNLTTAVAAVPSENAVAMTATASASACAAPAPIVPVVSDAKLIANLTFAVEGDFLQKRRESRL